MSFIIVSALFPFSSAFLSNRRHSSTHSKSGLFQRDPERTYGKDPIRDVIDTEGAMESFFSARLEWLPTFRTLAGSKLPVDTNSLLSEIEASSSTTNEWRQSVGGIQQTAPGSGIPNDPEDRKVLEGFLTAMHQSLVDIPVTDSQKGGPLENENDVHFLEEGRRMLAINRFHVLRNNQGGTLEAADAIFARCWNELEELTKTTDGHTGSIVFLPHYSSLSDLHRFTDMNLVRPIEWLGKTADFEITSLDYGSPAIRMLYKLRDMPTGEIEVQRFGGDPE